MLYSAISVVLNYSEVSFMASGAGFSAYGALIMLAIVLFFQVSALLANYFLRGIAAYKMAKRVGIKNAWLSFVPIGVFFVLNGLQDDGNGRKNNRIWGYLAVGFGSATLVAAVLLDALFASETLRFMFSEIGTETVMTSECLESGVLATALQFLNMLSDLALMIAGMMVYSNIFRAYAPERSTVFFITSLAAEIFIGTTLLYNIYLFILRNREKRSYSEYVFGRMSKLRGGTFDPYGNPYQRGGRNGYPTAETKKEDPFEEFSDKKDDPFSEFGNSSPASSSGGDAGNVANDDNGSDDGSDDMFS